MSVKKHRGHSRPCAGLFQGNLWLPASPEDSLPHLVPGALGQGRGNEGVFPPYPSRASQQARVHCWWHWVLAAPSREGCKPTNGPA